MQISRMFQIVYTLLREKNVTAAALAARFEVSVRTIYRDIDALCQAGIPIYTAQGKGGGIALMERFVLDRSVLSEREQDEILMALQNLSAARHPASDEVLEKLSGLFSRSQTRWIEVDFSPWGNDGRQKAAFELLKTAILAKRAVTFTYYSLSGEKSARCVEPVKLLFKDRAWYLEGYCRTRAARRTFKLTRMSGICLTEEACLHTEAEAAPPPEAESAGETVALVLDVSPEGAHRVYDDFDEENITRHEDGALTITVSMPAGEWLYPYLLSFGPALEVKAPQAVRLELARRLHKMASKYKTET
ncbi:Predicted DNA-binding transcriptional regulator YafY, contains an HTH and WYL domains [Sporobacter termitidis DSM 10068]|uniref:Predicted DNA-binding transcriptional regulator YafY, contains an HTH and WYL domains n=1 Tax=Sporobacter termitidis DSM 10068 TaxID=1123282 RepID=A0A1M5YNG3_9FIRM|nr:YafY family protein [Sporobacter termitidis]SHI13542.1 Predicted DNA-binding transcriptional regulator YafY, contains an HTH and WYL domains [Sporobacter termitidis DSM 10068]